MPKQLTDGPLPLALPPTRQMVKVTQRLRGHVTSMDWLPVGLDPAVDALRKRHLAQRERLVSAMTDESSAVETFAEEDRKHAEALAHAQRTGKAEPDGRTSLVERQAIIRDLDAVLCAAATVMAEVVQDSIGTLTEAEPGILAKLREEAAKGDDRIRRAQREVTAAQEEHYVLLQTGKWLQALVDDGPWQVSAPKVGPVPPNLSRDAVAGALERPWHREKTPAPKVPAGATA